MLEEYSASIKGSLNSIKCGKNTEKIGSSNFTVDIRFTKKFQERKFGNKNLDSRYEISKVWTNFFVEFEKIEFTT